MNKPNIVYQIGYYVFFILLAALLLLSFLTPIMAHYQRVLFGLILICPISLIVIKKLCVLLNKNSSFSCLFILISICTVFKLCWILLFKIFPETDYKMFFDTAASLSRNFVIENRYVALFPHIMGYSLFLSIFYRIFGINYLLAPILNVCLSSLSMALIYYICKSIINKETAITASILWIIFPSQTIYNMLTLSEPLYCTLLLIIWATIIYLYKNMFRKKPLVLILILIALSLFLALFNATRPLATIQFAAFLGWFLFYNDNELEKRGFAKKIVSLVIMLVVYSIFTFMTNSYITIRLGEKAASIPGYSFFVGFNQESKGTWNEHDSSLLSYYNNQNGWNAEMVQKQMFQETLRRIDKDGINFIKLFYDKYLGFLGDDSSAAYYCRTVLPHPDFLYVVSNIFYFYIILFSLFGIFKAIKTKQNSPLIMICLYAVGLVLAQLFVEVAGRYHYSITLSFIILASYGINNTGGRYLCVN